jgi:hypothetical protein
VGDIGEWLVGPRKDKGNYPLIYERYSRAPCLLFIR